ncbi:ATP synthase subunit I, partial [Achromobacter sp. SD115]|nr:ATP synthase subunit I [Achromobacter sp. SD115]
MFDHDMTDKVLVLSDADRAALNAQASRGLLLALAAQGAMGLAAAVIAGVVGGAAAGWSALS